MRRLALVMIAGALLALGLSMLVLGCSSSGTTGPGDGGDGTAEESVGPAGGTVEIEDEVTLEIPAGALADTTDFTIEEDATPQAPPAGQGYVSPVYEIGPSGTAFTAPATITLHYDENAVRADEEEIVICADDGQGGGWQALQTTVDAAADEASAEVDHLSMFAATVDTAGGGPGEGTFARLLVHRGIVSLDTLFVVRTDILSARFDSTVSPCVPTKPIRADTVTCNQYGLPWDPMGSCHRLTSVMMELIDLGETYEFNVGGRRQVPALTWDIDFPEHEPFLTYPAMMDTIPLSGFTVTWANGDGGDATLTLAIVSADTTQPGVYATTANDGSHEFTGGDLSTLSPGVHAIALNYFVTEPIDAPGYHPESFIEAKVTSAVDVYLE